MGIGTVEKNMLLILDISSITQVTGGGITLIPCRCLKMEGVNTRFETSCTVNEITRQVEEHVFGKDVRQMSDHSLFGRRSTTLVISRAFAVVFSRMSYRLRCPVLKVSLPEVYDKMAEINGFTVLQLLFEDIRLEKKRKKDKKKR